jgi:hypothetical protein
MLVVEESCEGAIINTNMYKYFTAENFSYYCIIYNNYKRNKNINYLMGA